MDIKMLKLKIKRNMTFLFGLGYKKFGKKSVIDQPLYIRNKKYITIGDKVCIHQGSRIECYDGYDANLIIGNNVGIGYNFQCLVTGNCIIGNNTLIASNVLIATENHGTNPKLLYSEQKLISKDVNIGENCWVGEKTIILPGVTLGNNVIVGAGAVVTKSFEDNCIIAGNPAKCIKKYDEKVQEWKKIINEKEI